MATDPVALARFEREARAVAALNHPAIVALHDVGTCDGTAYVVTELLEGETVRDRLERDGPVAPRRALAIAGQVALGLGAAHAQGIVHRDVKPENLFLLADGRVKVLDFGIARQIPAAGTLDETTLHTQPGTVMGTFGYLAPEVLRGEQATPRSDVFAFGLVVYEMLTGKNPFRRETVMETVSAVLRDDPPPLAVAGLPVPAARLVHRCLAPRPDDRPDSLREVGHHLLALVEDVHAPPAQGTDTGGGADGAWTLPRVRRWLALGCAAAVVSCALVLFAVLGRAAPPDAGASDRTSRIVRLAEEGERERLQITARLIALSSELRALLTTDLPTLQGFLENYRTSSDLLAVLDLDGRVLGSTDADTLPVGTSPGLTALQASPGGTVVEIGGRPFLAVSAAADAAGQIFGLVVAATPLDDGFARTLGDAADADVLILDDTAVRGTTLRGRDVPWPTLSAWRALGGGPDRSTAASVGARPVTAREVPLNADGTLSAVVLRPARDAASLRQTRTAMATAAGVLLLCGAAAGWWLPVVFNRRARQRS